MNDSRISNKSAFHTTNNNNYNNNNLPSPKRKSNSLKIGLSICRDIVEKIGPEKKIEIKIDQKNKKISFSVIFYKDLGEILALKPSRKRTELRKAL